MEGTIVTYNEVIQRAERFVNVIAPGVDKIPKKTLNIAFKHNARPLTELSRRCLQKDTFSKMWKKRRLVLVQKPHRPVGEPSSYRFVCWIRLVRFQSEQSVYNYSCTQKEKRRRICPITNTVIAKTAVEEIRWIYCTKKYCTIVTFYAENEFNSAYWPHKCPGT